MAEPLGRVNVEIGADTTKLQQGVQDANIEVKKLEKSADGLGKTMAKAQAVMSRLFIPAAIAGAVAGLTQKVLNLVTSVQTLRTGFQDTEKAARSMVENARLANLSSEAQEAVKIMRAFDDQINAVRRQAEEFKSSTAGFWLGIFGVADADALAAESIRNIQTAQAQAERELSRLRIAEARKVEMQRAEMARKAAGSLFDAVDDIELELLPEPERIIRRYELELLRLQDRFEELGILNTKQVQDALGVYQTFLARRRDADQEALRERERAEIEAGERVAKANADAMIREMERAAQTIRGEFGPAFLGGEQLVNAINRVATEINRRRNF